MLECEAVPFNRQPILIGELLELRPLRADDFDALFGVAADPRIWEQHPEPNRYQEEKHSFVFSSMKPSDPVERLWP